MHALIKKAHIQFGPILLLYFVSLVNELSVNNTVRSCYMSYLMKFTFAVGIQHHSR